MNFKNLKQHEKEIEVKEIAEQLQKEIPVFNTIDVTVYVFYDEHDLNLPPNTKPDGTLGYAAAITLSHMFAEFDPYGYGIYLDFKTISKKSDYLIVFNKRIAEKKGDELKNVIIHELKHVEQFVNSKEIMYQDKVMDILYTDERFKELDLVQFDSIPRNDFDQFEREISSEIDAKVFANNHFLIDSYDFISKIPDIASYQWKDEVSTRWNTYANEIFTFKEVLETEVAKIKEGRKNHEVVVRNGTEKHGGFQDVIDIGFESRNITLEGASYRYDLLLLLIEGSR